MLSDQRVRVALFYLSLIIFLGGLPFILSFALGYRFDSHTLKFTKSGIIVIKTQPPGANIFLDGRLLGEKTPFTLNELLPGRYNISLELEKHYPWSNEVAVSAGKVTYLEKIILFPLRPYIKQINKERLSFCAIDEKKGAFYYLNPEDNYIYRSDLQGEHTEKTAAFLKIHPSPAKLILSDDRDKILYFNQRQLAVVHIQPQNELPADPGFVMNYADSRIIHAFWHSDSFHLIVVTSKGIEVLEAIADAVPVQLVNLNKRNAWAHYDTNTDMLYFLDSEKAVDGNFYDNLYKMELSARTFPFQELMKLKESQPRPSSKDEAIDKKKEERGE